MRHIQLALKDFVWKYEKSIKLLLKAFLSISLLVYFIDSADPNKIAEEFLKFLSFDGILYLVLSISLATLSIFIGSVRWRVLLLVYKIKVKLSKLFSFYLIGLFFNNFLPTSIGGDIVRIMKIVRISNDKTQGTVSVIVERIIGMSSTLIMATVALAIIYQQYRNPKLLAAALILLSAITMFFASIISERIFTIIKKTLRKITVFDVGDKLISLFEAIHIFRNRNYVLFKIIMISK